jgi:hypothetical protein
LLAEIGGALPSCRCGLTVSNPPAQAKVQALADKLDELIAAVQSGQADYRMHEGD